jgi:glycosyltransferase involved in cell wall biosynthesis
MKLSIAIPVHRMPHIEYFLPRCLDSLWNQTFQDFEIVVTDNSDDDLIENICKFYGGIQYYRNPRKGMAQNTNEAIKHSKGKLIKILYVDDYMAHDRALRKIINAFEINDFEDQWLVTSCTHNEIGQNYTHSVHHPFYSENIQTGNNTIGSPSVLTIKNDKPQLFDEEMTWLLDADYYKRMYEKYGDPVILKDVNVVIGLHPGQATHLMGDERKVFEHNYITKKYAQ